eukprot:999941-Amphidinium_carterae.1
MPEPGTSLRLIGVGQTRFSAHRPTDIRACPERARVGRLLWTAMSSVLPSHDPSGHSLLPMSSALLQKSFGPLATLMRKLRSSEKRSRGST